MKIESIEHISLINPLDISERLAELAQLEKGWLNGVGEAPAKQQLTLILYYIRKFEEHKLGYKVSAHHQ